MLPAPPSGAKRASAIFLTVMLLISAPLFWAANAAGLIGDVPAASPRAAADTAATMTTTEGTEAVAMTMTTTATGGTLKTDDTSRNGHSTRGTTNDNDTHTKLHDTNATAGGPTTPARKRNDHSTRGTTNDNDTRTRS